MTGLGKALLLAQDAMPRLHLDATNPHFHSRFVSLPKLLETVRPVLNANGLILTQSPCVLLDGADGLRTTITHAETGEQLQSEMRLILSKQDAQGQGSAITYARRYAILSMLGLAGDEDDDGNPPPPITAPSPIFTREASATGASKAEVGAGNSRPAPNKPRGFLPGPTQPNQAIEKAKAAQAEKGDVPTEAGDPRNEVCHFGKNAGKRLGDLTKNQLEWYANKWEPKAGYDFSAQDRRLKLAAQMILGLAADEIPLPTDEDSVPF